MKNALLIIIGFVCLFVFCSKPIVIRPPIPDIPYVPNVPVIPAPTPKPIPTIKVDETTVEPVPDLLPDLKPNIEPKPEPVPQPIPVKKNVIVDDSVRPLPVPRINGRWETRYRRAGPLGLRNESYRVWVPYK